MPITITPPDQRVYAIRLDGFEAEVVAFNFSVADDALYIEYYDEKGAVYHAEHFGLETQMATYWLTCRHAIADGKLFISQQVEFYPLRRSYVS